MNVIWKQPLSIVPQQQFWLPRGARPLCIQVQHCEPILWYQCDSEAVKTVRRFDMYGTGREMPADAGTYIGTFQLDSGSLVFHVYEWEEVDNAPDA